MNQEKKKELSPVIRKVLKQYSVKATISVKNHSTIVCNVKSSDIDFDTNNGYRQIFGHYNSDRDSGIAKAFLTDLWAAMMTGNHDNSEIMTDYFDVGWYAQINIGDWDKPYILN